MAIPKKFHFTSHSKGRSKERVITEANFIEVVTSPKTKKQQYRGTHKGFVYLFKKEIEGKELHIVAEIYKDQCYFFSGLWNEQSHLSNN